MIESEKALNQKGYPNGSPPKKNY